LHRAHAGWTAVATSCTASASGAMKIWLITVGEPLPIESGQPRLLRTGILADLLARRGHQVTWWTSAFDHFRKRFHSPGNRAIEVRTGLSLRLLDGCGY